MVPFSFFSKRMLTLIMPNEEPTEEEQEEEVEALARLLPHPPAGDGGHDGPG